MENIKIEQPKAVDESIEQIKSRLEDEWEKTIRAVADSNLNGEALEKIKKTEISKLLKIYEEQERPVGALIRLLNLVEKSKNNIKKMALFYKDAFYNPQGSIEENRLKSYEMAETFTNALLDEKNKKEFYDIMKQ